MAVKFEPSQVSNALVEKPEVLRPIVPEVVMVPPVNPLLVATDVTEPLPVPAQRPLIEKQPVSTFIPEPKVEVAVAEIFT